MIVFLIIHRWFSFSKQISHPLLRLSWLFWRFHHNILHPECWLFHFTNLESLPDDLKFQIWCHYFSPSGLRFALLNHLKLLIQQSTISHPRFHFHFHIFDHWAREFYLKDYQFASHLYLTISINLIIIFLALRLIITFLPFIYFFKFLLCFLLQFLSLPHCLLSLFNHLLLLLNLLFNFCHLFFEFLLLLFKFMLLIFNFLQLFFKPFFLLFILFQFLLIFLNLFFVFCELLLVSNNFSLNFFNLLKYII